MQRKKLFPLYKMLHKKNPERKQKRMHKKMLAYIFFGVGIVGMIAGLVFLTFVVQSEKGNYVSPLASIGFVQASQKNNKAEQLKTGLHKNNISYKSIEKGKDGSYIVKLQDGGEVTFSSQKDIMVQIASLQYILSHLTMEGKLFTRLDLRFEKPVIVLKK